MKLLTFVTLLGTVYLNVYAEPQQKVPVRLLISTPQRTPKAAADQILRCLSKKWDEQKDFAVDLALEQGERLPIEMMRPDVRVEFVAKFLDEDNPKKVVMHFTRMEAWASYLSAADGVLKVISPSGIDEVTSNNSWTFDVFDSVQAACDLAFKETSESLSSEVRKQEAFLANAAAARDVVLRTATDTRLGTVAALKALGPAVPMSVDRMLHK